MPLARATLLTLTACLLVHAQEILPLSDVRAGQTAVGRTVFAGDQIEEFQVEILGVLDNVGPKQSLILARLSGGPLERTGVIAGMSGSPVYLDGKLLGAVAFSFPFSTEPLCGIRPIEDMLEGPETPAPIAAASPSPQDLLEGRPTTFGAPTDPAGSGPIPIAAPAAFGGFTARTLEVFGDRLRALGLQPLQGVGGDARDAPAGPLEPGSMISVGLVRGDLSVSAAGTVTRLDGERVDAFGHEFLSAGPLRLPMMRASVITVVPNLNNSFKLTADGPVIGALELDRAAGIRGTLGPGPRMIPVSIRVRNGADERTYQMDLIDDPFLTPFLLEVSAFSAYDARNRRIGPETLRVSGQARFLGDAPPLALGDVYSGLSGVGAQAAGGAAAALSFVLQTASGALTVDSVEIEIESRPADRRFRLTRAWAAKTKVRAGETVRLGAAWREPSGAESSAEIDYRVPPYVSTGPLHVLVSDGARLNFGDLPLLVEAGTLAPAELIDAVNGLRPANRLYARVWRYGKAFRVQSERLEQPPTSLRSVLDQPSGRAAGASAETQDPLAELAFPPFDGPIDGMTEVTLEVIE